MKINPFRNTGKKSITTPAHVIELAVVIARAREAKT